VIVGVSVEIRACYRIQVRSDRYSRLDVFHSSSHFMSEFTECCGIVVTQLSCFLFGRGEVQIWTGNLIVPAEGVVVC